MISKILDYISTIIISALVLLLIVLALYVSLGRYYLPLLKENRELLVEQFNSLAGVQIELGDLEGEWDRWTPAVKLSDFKLYTLSDAPAALEITRLELALDVIASLRAMELRFQRLHIRNVKVKLVQNKLGRWTLGGFKGGSGGGSSALVDTLLGFATLRLSNLDLEFTDNHGDTSGIQAINVVLNREGDFRRVFVTAANGDQNTERANGTQSSNSLVAVVEGQGDPRVLDSFSVKGYGKLQALQVPALGPTLSGLLKTEAQQSGSSDNIDLRGFSTSGEFWLDWRRDGFSQIQGELKIPQIRLGDAQAGDKVVAQDFAGKFLVEKTATTDWKIWVPTLELELEEQRVNLIDRLQLEMSPLDAGSVLSLKARSTNIAVLNRLLLSSGVLDDKLQEVLSTLMPTGQLRQFHLSIPTSKERFESHFRLVGEVFDFNASNWKGIPGLKGVNGYIDASLQKGTIVLQAKDFAIQIPQIYHHWLEYTQAEGTLSWTLKDKRLKINSDSLALLAEEGEAGGSLFLDLPLAADSNLEPILRLNLASRTSDARYLDKYLPHVVGQDLQDWLHRGVGEGGLSNLGFVYDGSLRKGGKPNIKLFFDAIDIDLKYHPDWPQLENISGFFMLNNTDVDVDVKAAKVFDIQVTEAKVKIRKYEDEDNLFVEVKGKANGDSKDGMRIIKESPIKQSLGEFVEQWQSGGDLQVDLAMRIPITSKNSVHEPEVDINVVLQDAHFRMPEQDLLFVGVNGDFQFSLDGGLNAKGIDAVLLHKPVHSVIKTDVRDGKHHTWINLTGEVESKHLMAWTKQPAIAFFEGNIAYEAQLVVDPDGQSFVRVDSAMENVRINLPAPFGKTAAGKRNLSFYTSIGKDERIYEIKMADMVQASFLQSGSDLQGGHIHLGADAKPVATRAITVSGQQQAFNVEQWLPMLDKYANTQRELLGETGEGLPLIIDSVKVGALYTLGRKLIDVEVSANYSANEEGFWRISLLSDAVIGDVDVFDKAAKPYRVSLYKLDLDELLELEIIGGVGQSGALLNPGELSATDMKINRLWYAGEDYGCWSFSMRPRNNAVVVSHLLADVKGLKLGNLNVDGAKTRCEAVRDGVFEGAQAPQVATSKRVRAPSEVVWSLRNGAYFTEFDGIIQSGELGSALEQWGYERMLESDHAYFEIVANWPGMPNDFVLAKSTGNMKFFMKNGSFVNASDTASSASKVVGFMNLDKLLRRLQLDFSDLTKKGLSFDKMDGELVLHNERIRVVDDVSLQGSSSEIHISGAVNLRDETVDNQMVVTLPFGENLPWIAGLAGGLPVAAGVYVASKVLKSQFDKLSSAVYSIKGGWDSPEVKFERLFSTKPMRTASENPVKDLKPVSTPQPNDREPDSSLPSPLPKTSEPIIPSSLFPKGDRAQAMLLDRQRFSWNLRAFSERHELTRVAGEKDD